MCVSNSVDDQRINPCNSRCAVPVLTIAGAFRDHTYVVICPCCNRSTPILSRDNAIATWNKLNPVREA